MQKMQIEYRDISDLIPYAGNPRKNDHVVNQMADMIKKHGFRVPVLIRSDNQLIDGHLRIKGAKLAGVDIIPCLIADDMSDEQIKAFRISVNKAAELAEWDSDKLIKELNELIEEEYPLASTGLSKEEIEKLLNPPEKPQVEEWQLGDVYEPFWIVIRGPIDQLSLVQQKLNEIDTDQIVIECSL